MSSRSWVSDTGAPRQVASCTAISSLSVTHSVTPAPKRASASARVEARANLHRTRSSMSPEHGPLANPQPGGCYGRAFERRRAYIFAVE
eukprot:3686454-Prymnesium_polylepis.1